MLLGGRYLPPNPAQPSFIYDDAESFTHPTRAPNAIRPRLLCFIDKQCSHRQINDHANKIASALLEIGIAPGDKLA